MLRVSLIASLLARYGRSQASIIIKACEINAVMKRKNSNCVGTLSDQMEAATASNLSEYTIMIYFIGHGPKTNTDGQSKLYFKINLSFSFHN